MNIHSRQLHAPLRGIFAQDSCYIARYAPFIWAKSPAKWDAQMTEINFLEQHFTKVLHLYCC